KAKSEHLNTRGFGGLPLTILSPWGFVFLFFCFVFFTFLQKRKENEETVSIVLDAGKMLLRSSRRCSHFANKFSMTFLAGFSS
ncbi:MAG TPA: hypothetical protein P5556_11060, partial [Candidatus Gastranaerophilales bacterium]|nr:hypothetical protein [Candidatus Gastranaerophilales bacterium]